jgi:spore coat protein U-like protein
MTQFNRLISGAFMHKILTATLAVGVMAAGVAQSATTITSNFQVSATVQATCSATAAALAFPTYTPGAGAQTSSSAITVKCTKGTAYTVTLNAGSTTGDAYTQRLMVNGTTNFLQYNLFTDNTFATVFGDGTGATGKVTGAGAGVATANTVTVYGQLPDNATNQAAVPGNYTDTIQVSVTY